MYAGSLGGLQGLDTAIEAVQLLTDVADLRLVFVGTGVAEDRLRAAADGMPNVHFLGQQPVEQMADLMALSDVQLVSLQDLPMFRATLPSKVQATLAAARPIVGAVAGDAARIITESGAGVVVPPGNPHELAAALRRLYSLSQGDRESMGYAGRQFYEDTLSARVGSAALAAALERAAMNGEGA
nr:glycosyltransferase family 4 protein [Phytoactinopolyspora mesophila]